MSEKRKGLERRENLRRKAEALVANLAPGLDAHTHELLTHELLVHKVEIEMQNEELKGSHLAMESARDKFVDFYEFAPVGLITLSREGLIKEINLTGCSMLGVERFRIVSRRLSSYVAPDDRDRWHRLFMRVMEHAATEKLAFELEMSCANGPGFRAHLNCVKKQIPDSPAELRISLTDLSTYKQEAA